MALAPNRALIGCFGLEGSPPNCAKSATWQFVLDPQEDGTTRLILRSRSADAGSAWATASGKLAYAFQFYMERKMLIEIQERAESFVAGLPRPLHAQGCPTAGLDAGLKGCAALGCLAWGDERLMIGDSSDC
jgi:hypothetical protein